jgi:hypothetical protein
MAEGWRRTWVAAGGVLAGVVLLAWLSGSRDERQEHRSAVAGAQVGAPVPQSASRDAASLQSASAQPGTLQAPGPTSAAAAPVSCTFAPLLAQGASNDGQFALQPVRTGQRLSEASAYAAVARETMAEGRPRDAEVALIMACRVAGLAGGTTSPLLGTAMLQLAEHYVDAARRGEPQGPAGAGVEAVLDRAEELLKQSVQVYTASLGRGDPRTREAGERLAELQQAPPSSTAAAQQKAAQAQTPAGEVTSAMGAARESPAAQQARAPDLPVVAHGSRPSFDCARAASVSERMICADSQLAQLDNDLGRLRAQARSLSADPAGFRQRDEQAWLQRESNCQGDKGCLLRWYETRKRQLLSEFGG